MDKTGCNKELSDPTGVRVDEKLVADLVSSLPDTIYLSDLEEREYTYRNREFLVQLGYPPNMQVMGLLSIRDVVHPDDLEAFNERLSKLRADKDGSVIEATCRMRSANDEWIWFSFQNQVYSRDEAGKPMSILGTIRDASTQMTSELMLRELVRQLRASEISVRERHERLEELNQQLANLATTDGLTGVYNYRAFHDKLDDEMRRARRFNYPLAVIVSDVDDFKAYNDRFGHPAGDDRLRQFGQMLKGEMRDVDFVSRTGGEEFAIILINTTAKSASHLAQQVVDRLNLDLGPKRLTASFGCVQLESEDTEKEDLLRRADSCLYEAKRMGKNCVVVESKDRKVAHI